MRLSRAVALSGACAALAAAGPPPAPAAAEAVTYQADPQHTGHVESGAPQPPLRRRWVARLGTAVSYPVASAGKVFVATGGGGAWRATHVVALSAASGRVVWKRDISAGTSLFGATLAVDAGRLFVLRDTFTEPDLRGLIALSPDDGRVLWESGPSGHLSPGAPVALDGAVYVADNHGLSAWRQEDGTLLWRTRVAAVDHSASPAVRGDAVLLGGGGCEPGLFAARRSDGTTLLEPVRDGCSGSPGFPAIVSGDRAYLGWTLLDAQTGAHLRKVEQRVYAVSPSLELGIDPYKGNDALALPHRLVARRPGDPRVRWRFRGDGYLDSSPLIAGRTVYVGSGSGRVFGVDAGTGRVRWRGDAGASVPAPHWTSMMTGLAAAEGLLLVPTRGGLAAFGSARR